MDISVTHVLPILAPNIKKGIHFERDGLDDPSVNIEMHFYLG